MDANQQDRLQAPQETSLPVPTPVDPANAVVLNILSPSNEVPGGRITFPCIDLNTKLSELKTRIRNTLQAAPAPERQRLIYRGHALLNTDATLRQVLRPPGSTEPHSDTYTLHLVLPPGNVAAAPIPAPGQFAAHGRTPAGLPQPPLQQGTATGTPHMPGVQLPQQVLAQAQAAQTMLQNQLNMIQQQLSGHNHQHEHQHHHPHPHQQAHPHAMPGMAGINMVPNGMQVTYQVHQHGQPGQPMPMPMPMPMPLNPASVPGHPLAANFQEIMRRQQLAQQQMTHPAVAGDLRLPIPGQAGMDPNNTGTSEVNNRDPAAASDLSGSNRPSTPEQPPVTTRIQETIGPQGQRIRTVVRGSVNMTISRHSTPNPASRPASTEPAASANQSTASIPGMNLSAQSSAPAIHTPHNHAPAPRPSPVPFTIIPSTTTAWILSSPNGPEALLFAPGHGYFSSAPQTTSSARITPSRTSHHGPESALSTNLPARSQDATGAALPQPGQARAAEDLAQLPRPNAAPAAQLPEENEFLNFIVARGWLFLRLYVFTFFISDPNTWRRYLLLALATFIVMLPRENFLQHGMAQIRQHIDALIGPPVAAAARDGRAADPSPMARAGAAAPPRAGQVTPAENAARLLREQEARNPNVVRDVLFRVERVAAMFLASLVPGVGERHIRAREEQRREAERAELERRTREGAERAQAQTQQADAASVPNTEADSTAVEVRDDAGEARERMARAQAVNVEG